MKRIVLFISLMIASAIMLNAQEVITGYTFPGEDPETNIYPDQGIENNSGYYISAEDTVAHPNTNKREIYFTNGVESFAATADDWHNGAYAKLWSIKLKAEGYKDLNVSSKQRAGGNKPGPRDWQIQARLSGGEWINIEGGEITCANDWTTGVADNLALPEEFNNPGGTSVYIRWIMTSNLDINGDPVDSTGISKIDDVIVTGVLSSGVEETLFSSIFSFYPNPLSGNTLNIKSKEALKCVRIFNTTGAMVKTINQPTDQIILNSLSAGYYFVQPVFENENSIPPQRLIIN